MHSRTILPLVLLLTSACAQVPGSSDTFLQQSTSQSSAERSDLAREAMPPEVVIATQRTRSSRALPSPQLQAADQLAASAPAAQPAPPEPPKNLWERIHNGFTMAPMENDLVREWENWYASRPDYVARMIDRSSHFLFHIVEEVEKRKMPMEIALLPMIESAYNPVAYSRSHASGIWQFIPSTGKNYGLRQNWWYDGRRDVIAATEAALDYLEKLYGMFNDWPLALASYNWGEGAVSRAMERNRAKGLPTDYESLTVPAETRGYLPKLIAVKNIISNPARYGLQIADVPNEPFFDTVIVKRHIDVTVAAKLAEMPIDEFKFLNPGHNKPVIKAGEAERIVLPKDKVVTFLSNYEKHDKPLVSWRATSLKPGQKAEKFAAQHGMTVAELKQVNGLQNQKKLVVGQPLLVPVKGGVEDPELPDLPATPISLPKAIQAAKHAAQAKKNAPARGGKVVVKKAVQKRAAQKRGKQPVKQLRAENGKRVKVVAARKAPASSKKMVAEAPQR